MPDIPLQNWLPYFVAAAAVSVGLVIWRLFRSPPPGRASYIRQDFLLSPEERQLFKALRASVGEDYVIFGKVRVEDVIAPRSAAHVDAAWEALETAGDVHFPFVLCKQSDLSIACAIQLIQHRIPGRTPTTPGEHPLKTICASGGLPLLRLEASPFYDRNDIRLAVAEAVRKEPLFISEPDGRKEPTIAELERLDL